MTILVKEDFAPKIQTTIEEGPYLARGDAKYKQLCEKFRIPVDDRRPATPEGVSEIVKMYLVVFVSKEYARDRIGSGINASFDGQQVDQWQGIFNAYDKEEYKLDQELTYFNFQKDEDRGDIDETPDHTFEIERG